MAMQRSDELPETSFLLFQQVKELGETTVQNSIGIVNEEAGFVELSTTVQGHHLPHTLNVPIDDPYVMAKAVAAWKANRKSLKLEFAGQELKEYNEHRNSFFETKVNFPEDLWIVNIIFFSKGWLSFSSDKDISDETFDLLKRFAAVFEQTYTRFNDLKQAEAQARESQIEAALEKVRSRSMGMQKSEELKEVIQVVYDQFVHLNIHVEHTGFVMDYKTRDDYYIWIADHHGAPSRVIIPYFDSLYYNRFNEAKEKGENFFATNLSFEEKNRFYQKLFEYVPGLPEQAKEFYFSCAGLAASTVLLENVGLYIENFSGIPFSDEENKTLMRFGKVFQQTYTRFLDLQRAEAQAREGKIEAALERVRSRSLAMHSSGELGEVVTVVLNNLLELGYIIDQGAAAHLAIFSEGTKDFFQWSADPALPHPVRSFIPYTDLPILTEFWDARQKGHDFFAKVYSFDEKNTWFNYAFEHSDLKHIPGELKKLLLESETYAHSVAIEKNSAIIINSITGNQLSENQIDILRRFSKVFEQAYTRFLDLQKVEAQAREAQIEAGLERVRYSAMAMQSSEDVGSATAVVFNEISLLGVETLRCGITIIHPDMTADVWAATATSEGKEMKGMGSINFTDHPLWVGLFDAWKNKEESFTYALKGDDLKSYYKVLTNSPNYNSSYIQNQEFPDHVFYASFFEQGAVFTFSLLPHNDEKRKVLKRFTAVFSLTFRRYLDLQKAEANAREAQIEAGLERVRARTMAMHSSDDVSVATATMFTELEKLGIENFRGGITIIKTNRTQEVWSVNNLTEARLPDGHGKTVKAVGTFNIEDHPFWQLMYKEWEDKKEFLYYFLNGKDKENYVKILSRTQNYLPHNLPQFPDVHFQVYFFGEGAVWTNSLQPHSEEAQQVMKKFTSVFSLTFRRYQDLKKAEAQAREATIEASLERVRAKAMSMHNSQDLSETVNVFFKELKTLSITPLRCGVGVVDETERTSALSATTASKQGDSYEIIGKLNLSGHPVLDTIFEHWKLQQEYYPVLKGAEIKPYYEAMNPQVRIPDHPDHEAQYGSYFYFKEGLVFAWTEKGLTEEEIKIFRRFTSVISLTYRRYMELQKSETNAREAVKQASLDRIRADIASMRTVNDLQRITPLIWDELTIVGVPFIRCGVFIMDEEQKLIHTFLSTPDGKAIGAFHLPYDTPGNIRLVLKNWQDKKNYTDHWDESEFHQFAEILAQQGALESAENYLKTIPHGGFYLHFLPFLQGMLYVGNTSQLSNEEIKLIQAVADAFSTAYARYEDFNKLEAAKEQIENTLTNLKQTQAQLVQSEKMASLGELTAGIAHEIQNPLNFVNNFSDVSTELVDEMNEEIAKGNLEDAKQIAEDLKQNLEKINHHGKRAGDIVKGMLQHSRSGSGQKEMTDINALADEYLRLAYHGLRAKDKSFNAKFETSFDLSIEKVNVMPQDIGRVVLNLINNAFYAVSEKKKQNTNGFEPTVSVSTKKENGKIEVSVKDNGNGIPQKVLDKIFQPFFTTKPTGQGTGLGLSLSYDIVKAHGGELKVETKEGDGSEFILQIPAN